MAWGHELKMRGGRLRALCVALLLTGLLSPVAAQASEAPEPEDSSGMRVLAQKLPGARLNNDMIPLWLWPKGRRGFQLDSAGIGRNPGWVDHQETPSCVEEVPKGWPFDYVRCPNTNELAPNPRVPLADLVSYDLDTNEEIARRRISEVDITWSATNTGAGQANLGAVDPDGGALFLPFQGESKQYSTVGYKERDYATKFTPMAGGNSVCSWTGDAECFAGILMVDGATLDTVKTIRLSALSTDGIPLHPVLRALEYVPPRPEGGVGKLLAVVEEWGHNPERTNANLGTSGANVVYLVQFDPQSGRQDWVVRLDACRYQRDSASANPHYSWPRPNAATVFRSASVTDRSVWVGCHAGPNRQAAMVKVPLDERDQPSALPVQADVPDAGAALGAIDDPSTVNPATAVGTASGQQAYPGPVGASEFMSDPVSGRVLMKVIGGDPIGEVWWVFDTTIPAYLGTVGIGGLDNNTAQSVAGLDRGRGRLYIHVPPFPGRSVTPGMYVVDIRRTPLSQALVFPGMAELRAWNWANASEGNGHRAIMPVDPGDENRLPRVYWRHNSDPAWVIIEDGTPVTSRDDASEIGSPSLDLDEAPGVTNSFWDGTARGYGARVLLVGGIEAMARAGNADAGAYQTVGPRGNTFRQNAAPLAPYTDRVDSPCTTADREIVLASVGGGNPAVVDVAGGRGSARPISVDSTLAADIEAPVSRCAPLDWHEIWETGLVSSAPVAEPSAPSEALFGKSEASCLSSGDKPHDRTGGGVLTDSVGDPVGTPFSAAVTCSPDDVSGWSQARIASVGELDVSSAYATFRLYRDPGRGIVARVESVTRGVSLPGAFRIDTVRTVAESWANGRRNAVSEDAEAVVNCDAERSAGTCFRRHLFGVVTPAYSCGPCGDESRVEAALTRAMGTNGTARLRQPDPRLAAGAENGSIAAIQKPDHERFADLVLNNDLLQTVVAGLEITRFANPGYRVPGNSGTPGRQIYQFAGVEVSSSYGITCLLVYDEAANTCAEPAEAPGSIQVTLSDTDGKPLAGGAFELREDVDADGVLGLKDTLLPDGACVTAEDGIGTCTFENLQPGSYLVSQVAAPPGYAKSAEPWVSEVASGEQRTVAFTNVSNVSTIDLKATDENGAPISGAVFAAYPDPDSDGKVAPDAKPAAECTTDDQGACTMKVPAGSYVLVQTSAPGGLEGIEPVPFTFASGGQVASVTVVNYPPESPQAPAPAAAPVDYTPPVDYAPPVESVSDFTPVAEAPVIEEPAVSVPERIGGTVTQVIRAPGDALRLLARDPKQAVAWTAALALFCLAAMAVRRRQQAMALLDS